jgi:hypothetical protein
VTYEIAVRALAQQEGLLGELRSRTGTLLTASSLVGSFLGAEAIASHGLNAWVDLAFGAFAASVVLGLFVLLPKEQLVFVLDGPEAYEQLYGQQEDEREVYRILTYWLEQFRGDNEGPIKSVARAFRFASLALVAEIVFLALALALD